MSLYPATSEELAQSLAHALRFEGRKRIHHGEEIMARLMAEHLVRYLENSGYIVMKQRVVLPPSDPSHGPHE